MRSYECSKFSHCGDDLYQMRTFAIVGTHNSSLDGAMKLKFAPFCSPRDVLLHGISFFAEVKIFRFWLIYNRGHFSSCSISHLFLCYTGLLGQGACCDLGSRINDR